MILSYKRSIAILFSLLALVLLAACSGGSEQTQQKPQPSPTPTPTEAQRVLKQTSNMLTNAKTLHGTFVLNFKGQNFNGTLNSEVWNVLPAKNRTEVHKSTIDEVPSGTVTVSNGKKLWQYDPTKKVVYSGPAPTNSNGVPGGTFAGNGGGQGQMVLNLVQTVLTRSEGTMRSSNATVNKHKVYQIHVVPQGDTSSTGPASFSYDGVVSIDKETYKLVNVDLNIQGIGRVVLDVPSLVLDQPIADSVFTFVAPRGVKELPLQEATPSSNGGGLTLAQAQNRAGYHLLSIPPDELEYMLLGVTALGSPGSEIYNLNYMKGNLSFTIAQSKTLANLPGSGEKLDVRGAPGTFSSQDTNTTLAWTEKGVGIRITGSLNREQALAVANLLR